MKNIANYINTGQMPSVQEFPYQADMRQALHIRFVDMLVFVIPMLRFLEIEIVGRLFATDIILIGLFPFLILVKGHRLGDQMPRMLIILCFLWLFGQATTDLIRQTPFDDWSRGCAKIAVTLINFSTLYLLIYGNRRRILLFALGFAAGGILKFYFNPGVYSEAHPWKFGIGPSITLVLLILCVTNHFLRVRFLPLLVVLFLVFFNLYMGSRGTAGICFLTMVYMVLQWLYGHKAIINFKFSIKNMVMIGLGIMLMGSIFIQGYGYLACRGLLGEGERQKYFLQVSGDFGLFLGGRGEIVASIHAIMDSPIIGHGSWAKDYKYADMYVYLKHIMGYHAVYRPDKLGLIPSHSHLFGGWVEAGILGAVFWIWVLSLPIRMVARLYRTKEPLTTFIVFISFGLIWNIFFSPFAGVSRFIIPYHIILIMSFLPGQVSKNRDILTK
jgi:hypothetical protein